MSTRTKALVLIACVVVPVVAFGLYYFAPWTLFTSKTVNDAAPAMPASTAAPAANATPASTGPAYPRVLSTGSFIAQGHPTSGTVSIIEVGPGQRILRLENLKTDNGPDVKVWLTDQAVSPDRQNVFDDGKYVNLGALKGNLGNQNYTIPASADLSALTSVSLWCDRFDVSFGAAALQQR